MKRRTNIKRNTMLVMAMWCSILVFSGCRSPIRPIVMAHRSGEFYCYTKNYLEVRASLTGEGGHGEMWGNPFKLLVGMCLMGPPIFLERYIVSPIADTMVIPYDCYLRARNVSVCKNDGFYIKVMDRAGHPVQGFDIELSISAKNGWRIIYDGGVCPRGCYSEKLTADENGEVYVPVDTTSCDESHFSGRVQTSFGDETFDGYVRRESLSKEEVAWVRTSTNESRPVSLTGQRSIPDMWHYVYCCPRCNSMGIPREAEKWNVNGVCVKCGKQLSERERKHHLLFFLRRQDVDRNMRPPLSKMDYLYICGQTGLDLETLESIYGVAPINDGRKRVMVRLKGMINDVSHAREACATKDATNLEPKQ